MTKLTLDDIADLRAYERERVEFRTRVIALKKRRRVGVGPFTTLVFENRDTIRFQIQEMARAEKIISDEGIQTELDVYNPLIPELGSLCATLFLELTSQDELREWLPKLVGIEQAVLLRLGSGPEARDVRCRPDPDHAEQLTRDEITAAVHYVHFDLDPTEVEALAAGPVALVVDHPAYQQEALLGPETVAELLSDLRG
ncbi:MAG: DUF3501 family protein [Acidimicrobiia bacterium]